MKSSMEALGESGVRNALPQVVTLALVLGLWIASVLLAQHETPAAQPRAAGSVALAEPGTVPAKPSHQELSGELP